MKQRKPSTELFAYRVYCRVQVVNSKAKQSNSIEEILSIADLWADCERMAFRCNSIQANERQKNNANQISVSHLKYSSDAFCVNANVYVKCNYLVSFSIFFLVQKLKPFDGLNNGMRVDSFVLSVLERGD